MPPSSPRHILALNSLRRRIGLLLIITLTPALILIVITAYTARVRERRAIQDQAYQVVSAAATSQELLIRSAVQAFAAIDFAQQQSTQLHTTCPMLPIMLNPLDGFENIALIGPDGSIACAARPVAAGAAVASSAWFAAARATGDLVVGNVAQEPFSPTLTAIVARKSASSTLTLAAALDLQQIAALLAAIPLPPGSSVNLIDHAGNIAARHPDHQQWVGKPANAALLVAALNSAGGVFETDGVDGVQRLFGFRRVSLPGSPLLLTVGLPSRVVYAAADRRLLVNLAILAIVTVVAYLFSRRVSFELFGRKIERVLTAARRLSAGDLAARTGAEWTPDELGELARTFDAMAWNLESRTRELQDSIVSLRLLTARLESVREEERMTISREIHDELGQALTGIRMDLDRLEERLTLAALPTDAGNPIRAKVASARTLVDLASDTARRISRQLRPSVLDVLGFQAAIEWQLEDFQARTGISAELVAERDVASLDEPRTVALFRILQETLTNVMRHAAATQVTVRLATDDGHIVLEIMDNGRGFDLPSAAVSKSLGLLGMRERAAALGGQCRVSSAPGQGTTVNVQIPIGDVTELSRS